MLEDELYKEERQGEIVEYVNKHSKVTTKELSELFNISMVTIRNDINHLDEQGFIKKVHGGALALTSITAIEVPFKTKKLLNIEEKIAIGKAAAKLIHDSDIVILDSGTTTLEIAKNIKAKDVKVITNDIQIAYVLSDNENVQLYLTGGYKEANLYTIAGQQTIDFIRNVTVDKLFLGCDAIDFKYGITDRTFEEVAIKKAFINAAKKVISVFDSSKQNKRVFSKVCDIRDLDVIVTNSIEEEDFKFLSQLVDSILITDGGK